MYDAFLMSCGQRHNHLNEDLEYIVKRQVAFIESLSQRLPFDQLTGDVVNTFDLIDVVDRNDVRMIQSEQRARLLLKSGDTGLIARESLSQQFQCNLSAQLVLRNV